MNPVAGPGGVPGALYVSPAELAALVRVYRRTHHVSERLGAVLLLIAGGVYDRFYFTRSRDDFVGGCVLHLLGSPLRRVKPHNNPFSYFTTCAVNWGRKQRKKERRDGARAAAYVAQRRDELRPRSGRRVVKKHVIDWDSKDHSPNVVAG